MKGIKITTDNVISTVDVQKNGSPLYDLMRKAVGGHCENVYPRRLKRGFVMIVNEEGLLHDLPINAVGSYLYGTDLHGQPIVGDVIILKLGYYQGELDVVGMTDNEANELMNDFIEVFSTLKSVGDAQKQIFS